jgi:hypothetical protein
MDVKELIVIPFLLSPKRLVATATPVVQRRMTCLNISAVTCILSSKPIQRFGKAGNQLAS